MSQRLQTIFGISVPLFILHGIEEYLTGFSQVDPIFSFVFRPILNLPIEQATFLVYQIMLWVFLILFSFFLFEKRWQHHFLVIPGIIYFLEIDHLYKALMQGSYYPGSITALAFPILGFFFWKEYLKHFKSNSSS